VQSFWHSRTTVKAALGLRAAAWPLPEGSRLSAGKEIGSKQAGGSIGSALMCDYSLHNVKTRPARVGEKLITRDCGTGSRGFAASEDKNVAVCLLPSTELSFAKEVSRIKLWPWSKRVIKHKTAIFRQINKHERMNHHDALEFRTARSCC
jgi:hypothetical protein